MVVFVTKPVQNDCDPLCEDVGSQAKGAFIPATRHICRAPWVHAHELQEGKLP